LQDNLVAFDSRISQQKSGLETLAIVVRKIEGDIARGERISAGRERDRDALLEIEQSLQDEGDVARESRVRLEEFEYEIKEAQKKLDAIAVKMAEKRAEEEDLRLSKVVRAEQDKKQAAQDRNYKEAQRLRDEVARMKARCVELESDMEELQVQQKEHQQRMESCQKESESEREKLQSLQLETDSLRLGAIERKLRLLLSIKLRITKEIREHAAVMRSMADDSRKVDETESDRKQLVGDLSLVELHIEESLSECVVLADRCGQPERVEEIREIVAEAKADEAASAAAVATSSRPSTVSPRAVRAATPPPPRVAEEEEEPEPEEVKEEAPVEAAVEAAAVEATPELPVIDSGAADQVALQKELEKLTGEWEQALEEENYELAEGLDAQIAALKLKVK
jgi:hypothetical protein